MDLQFIENIAKKRPALARAINASILSLFGYLLGVLATGDPFNQQALIQAVVFPLAAYVDKKSRDISSMSK